MDLCDAIAACLPLEIQQRIGKEWLKRRRDVRDAIGADSSNRRKKRVVVAERCWWCLNIVACSSRDVFPYSWDCCRPETFPLHRLAYVPIELYVEKEIICQFCDGEEFLPYYSQAQLL